MINKKISMFLSLIKWPVALVAIIFLPALTIELWNIILQFILNINEYYWVGLGMIVYYALWKFLLERSNMSWLSTLEHEITHCLFAWLSFNKVTNIHVTLTSGGHMNYAGTIAFAYPSTTTAVYNGASGVDTYSINIPGTWTTSQASQATIMTTICNTNVGLGAVTCAIIGMPSMISGYLNFVIQVINASHQAQQCDFYYTVNCGSY